MAQSKYILATYSPKPGRVNKHCINLMTDSHAGSIDAGSTKKLSKEKNLDKGK